ncbi:MAG: hypothetical protein AB4911_09010 [Oscillochloridaceae bacterium umkhey_bin13]
METRTPSKVALTEYMLAPWHLRLGWWLMGQLWRFGQLFIITEEAHPEQINPLWHR